MSYFSFTVWIQDDGGEFDHNQRRKIMRDVPGRLDDPLHIALKDYVIRQIRVNSPSARVEFGPISESKRQG